MTRDEFYNEVEENDMNIPPMALGRGIKKHPQSTEHIFNAVTSTARGREWMTFALLVLAHVETYTVGQYGDAGEDPASNYTVEDALRSASKYIARFGRNAREGEQFRDFLKHAHYVQIAASTWSKQNG